MALPLIPFAAGLALGSLVTWLMNDEWVRRKLVEAARRASGVGADGLDYLKQAAAPAGAAAGEAPPDGEMHGCERVEPPPPPQGGPDPEGDQVRNW